MLGTVRPRLNELSEAHRHWFTFLEATLAGDGAKAIEAAGATRVYLPPYSPDFNPIEPMWSKVKQSLRSTAARTFAALLDAIKAALASIRATDCIGFYTGCGYAT